MQAGEPWDALVARTVAEGLAGLEALSGIPGSTGASPVQNIGAYGQEVADVLEAIDFLDYETGEVERLGAADLGLGYRTSALKRGRVGVVLSVDFALTRGEGPDALGLPVAYPQLAGALGVELGDRVPVARVRQTVLALRASKGMVLDDADHDTWSAGSFFTNPIVSAAFARTLPADAPRWPQEDPPQDLVVPLGDAWEVADAIVREAFDRRRRTIVAELDAIPGFVTPTPQGAFYVYPDVTGLFGRDIDGVTPTTSLEVADVLLEKAEVAAVPGEAFGPSGFLQFRYALGDDALLEGVRRIRDLLA